MIYSLRNINHDWIYRWISYIWTVLATANTWHSGCTLVSGIVIHQTFCAEAECRSPTQKLSNCCIVRLRDEVSIANCIWHQWKHKRCLCLMFEFLGCSFQSTLDRLCPAFMWSGLSGLLRREKQTVNVTVCSSWNLCVSALHSIMSPSGLPVLTFLINHV